MNIETIPMSKDKPAPPSSFATTISAITRSQFPYSQITRSLFASSLALLLMFLLPLAGSAQQNGQTGAPGEDDGIDEANEFATSIEIGGRYVEGTGIELRYFPQKRVVLNTGFREGFVIERAVGDSDEFTEIARLLPFTEAQWDAIMDQAEGESYDLLDLARGYLDIAQTEKGGTFDFETGIQDMRSQRADEDFEHAVFMLTAARDAAVAEALAMSFTDTDVTPGESYTYRVMTVADPPVYNLVPAPFSITAEADDTAYENEVFFYEGDTWINFFWVEDERLSLYTVERKDPGSDEFRLITSAPQLQLRGAGFDAFEHGSFRDEDLENYQAYTYRFYGQNLFGERILFAEVEAMPRDRTPPEPPRILTLEHHKPREVLLEWEMNDPPAPDLMGVVVARSHQVEGEYRIIHPELLPETTRSLIDTTFVEGQPNYYVIQAVDTAFNVSSSLPVAVTLIDTIPPVQPVFLSGEVDSSGVVTLIVEKNEEPDLMGYRLFRSNDPDHEFSVIFEGFVDDDSLRHEIPVVFSDTITLNSLTPEVYYKVRALDFNFNQSEFSDVLAIARPDTIPPITPVFKRVVTGPDVVELEFAPSGSRDVALQTLYRKTSMLEPWLLRDTLSVGQTAFSDTLVTQGTMYYYSLRAVDVSGNWSDYAHPVSARPYDSGVRPPVENLQAMLDEENGMIRLTWNYQLNGDDVFFVIYRQDDRGHFIQHRRTAERHFEERNREGSRTVYAVKAFTTDGGQSRLSEALVIQQ